MVETVNKIVLDTLASIAMLVAFLVLASSGRQVPPLLSGLRKDETEEQIRLARQEAIDRSTHFEQLLVALGSFELGILAYIGKMVAEQKGRIDHPQLVFALAILLFFAVTVAYLHTWKVYMAYGAYAVRLEIHSLRRGLRVTSEVFDATRRPLVGKRWRLVSRAANGLQVVSLFPIFILVAAVLGFATPLTVPFWVAIPLAVLLLAWAMIFALPASVEFLKLVDIERDLPT